VIAILEAVRQKLAGDAAVAAMLATYPFVAGSPPAPAVFLKDVIPADATLPAIIITETAARPWSTLDADGYEYDLAIRCYGDKAKSDVGPILIGERIYVLLSRAALDVDGHMEFGCYVDPPVFAPDPDGYPGVLILATVRALREEVGS